jgi:hypothetical protein
MINQHYDSIMTSIVSHEPESEGEAFTEQHAHVLILSLLRKIPMQGFGLPVEPLMNISGREEKQ